MDGMTLHKVQALWQAIRAAKVIDCNSSGGDVRTVEAAADDCMVDEAQPQSAAAVAAEAPEEKESLDFQLLTPTSPPAAGLRQYLQLTDPPSLHGYLGPMQTSGRIFIRQSYREMATAVMQAKYWSYITGNAGIGKSSFILYLLFLISKLRSASSILWSSAFFKYTYLLQPDGQVLELPLSHDHTAKDGPANFLIADAVAAPLSAQADGAKIVQLSSPHYQFEKTVGKDDLFTTRFFSVWSADEMRDAVSVLKDEMDPRLLAIVDEAAAPEGSNLEYAHKDNLQQVSFNTVPASSLQ